MKLTEVVSFRQIKDGDTLLVESNQFGIELFKNIKIKITVNDGREIILRKKGNVYFNFDMYMKAESHVNEFYKVEC